MTGLFLLRCGVYCTKDGKHVLCTYNVMVRICLCSVSGSMTGTAPVMSSHDMLPMSIDRLFVLPGFCSTHTLDPEVLVLWNMSIPNQNPFDTTHLVLVLRMSLHKIYH